MTFQQVTLVVPLTPNARDGDSDQLIGAARYHYRQALAELEESLVALFGGFTAVDGRGAWRPEEIGETLYEDVRVFTLAAHIGLTTDALAELRQHVKVLLDQRAVYLAAYDLAEKPVQ